MNYNSWWYLGLIVLSLSLLIFIYFKKRSTRFLLLFFVMVECAFLIETVIYVFKDCYKYLPKIINYNSYYDSNAGALVSDLLTIPTLTTLIAVFNLNWVWICFFTAFLTGIEWLFLKLHIYVHHWWKIKYTALGLLFVFFPLGKVFYRQISKPMKGILHSIFLFLCTASITACIHIFPILWFSSRAYLPGWFQDPSRDTTAFAALYYLFLATDIVILVKIRWKHKAIKYVLMTGITFVSSLILTWIGVQHSYVWWDPWYYIIYPVIILKISEMISKSLSKGTVKVHI